MEVIGYLSRFRPSRDLLSFRRIVKSEGQQNGSERVPVGAIISSKKLLQRRCRFVFPAREDLAQPLVRHNPILVAKDGNRRESPGASACLNVIYIGSQPELAISNRF